MSKLDELIKELCPNGVEYKKVKDAFIRIKGTPITATKMKKIETPDGEIRIFAGGKTVINAKEKDIPNANITRVPAVLVQSRGVIDAVYYDKPSTFKNEMWAYTQENKLTVKFLYYVLKNNVHTFREAASGMGSLPQISLTVTEDFLIPVPPLPVQEEIVRILDNFTELTARRKQYEYYRDSLLTFGDDVEWKTLGELFEFKNGLNKEKEAFGKGKTIVNFTDVYNKRWLTKNRLKGLVDVNVEEQKRYSAKKGDVFFKRTSETKEDVRMASVLLEDIEGCVFSGFVLRARPLTDFFIPKFYSYYFSTPQVRKVIVQYASFTTRALTSGPRLSKIKIPVISKEKQERIVAILDRFESLCNDISSGLPAEIEARQKQYEYYRDKLLTFDRIEA